MADKIDILSLEIGSGLIPLLRDKETKLLKYIKNVEKILSHEMGFEVPEVKITENITLEPFEYSIKIKETEKGKINILIDSLLCIIPGSATVELEGEELINSVFGDLALWINKDKEDEAKSAGYIVIGPPKIISTHLGMIIEQHITEIKKYMMEEQTILITKNQAGCIEENIIVNNKDLLYSLSNSIDDIEIAMLERTGQIIELKNTYWKINTELSINVKNLMNKHQVNYSMTTLSENNNRELVINMYANDVWFIAGYTEIDGIFCSWDEIKNLKFAIKYFKDEYYSK